MTVTSKSKMFHNPATAPKIELFPEPEASITKIPSIERTSADTKGDRFAVPVYP